MIEFLNHENFQSKYENNVDDSPRKRRVNALTLNAIRINNNQESAILDKILINKDALYVGIEELQSGSFGDVCMPEKNISGHLTRSYLFLIFRLTLGQTVGNRSGCT